MIQIGVEKAKRSAIEELLKEKNCSFEEVADKGDDGFTIFKADAPFEGGLAFVEAGASFCQEL